MVIACQDHSYVFNAQEACFKIPGFTIVHVLGDGKVSIGSVNINVNWVIFLTTMALKTPKYSIANVLW